MSDWPTLKLPVLPPFPPMEARVTDKLPSGTGWQFEPKWDGFRCLVFRDHDAVALQSKAGQPLTRYFPDVVAAVQKLHAKRFVIDTEIVSERDGKPSFDDLLLRIHPAASRIAKLAASAPATLICFDLLVDGAAESLLEVPLRERRASLESFAREALGDAPRVRLSPATTDRKVVERWQATLRGRGMDGLMAKKLAAGYLSGTRDGMVKLKWVRSADCVVGGFRYAQAGGLVGSLLLGLYDEQGLLHHVGFCSTVPARERAALTARLQSMVSPPGFTGRAPGGPSRWSKGRATEWEPLEPKLVVEVSYDHFSGGRFRHGTGFLRWRPEKAPGACGFEQLGLPADSNARVA